VALAAIGAVGARGRLLGGTQPAAVCSPSRGIALGVEPGQRRRTVAVGRLARARRRHAGVDRAAAALAPPAVAVPTVDREPPAVPSRRLMYRCRSRSVGSMAIGARDRVAIVGLWFAAAPPARASAISARGERTGGGSSVRMASRSRRRCSSHWVTVSSTGHHEKRSRSYLGVILWRSCRAMSRLSTRRSVAHPHGLAAGLQC